MIIILDTSLSENAELMAELASEMNEAGIEYRVNSEMYPGSVRWRRKVTERSVNENAEVQCVVHDDFDVHLHKWIVLISLHNK